MSTPETFYITTAIDYPNSAPHMGHAYEKVVADFYARTARLRGWRTRFLVGLDEHGQKIQEAAAGADSSPQAFVDDKAVVFRELYQYLEITNDDFIRTSEPRHHEFVRGLYERVRDAGDIYKGVYVGDYCIGCEKSLSKSELVDGKCPVHDRETTPIEEESYFFRLGKYRDVVREHIEKHPEFVVPTERRNEVLARLREDVLDLSISRSTFDWGIPLPDDAEHVLYVWFDALSNYMSALCKPDDISAEYWPAQCHVIGKDILWFHAFIWPAMLLSAGHELPKQIYAHGFILDKGGRKMAKQLGNVVDPLEVCREYSVDVLRYYCLRAFSSGSDGKFSVEDLEKRYDRELANDFGNLVMRVTKLVETRCDGEVGPPAETNTVAAPFDHSGVIAEFLRFADAREHHRGLDGLWSFVRSINAYLNDQAPWKLTDPDAVAAVLYHALDGLRTAVHLVEPVMPAVAQQAAAGLGFPIGALADLEPCTATYRVAKAPALFPRREKPKKDTASGETPAAKPAKAKKGAQSGEKDPFAKLDLRVGIIRTVREHPDADKLFAMEVDIGEDEPRSICAGLREFLTVDELQDRKVLVLANLKPAKMRGVDSRGMVLATDLSDGRVVPVDPGAADVGAAATVEGVESAPKKKLSKSEFDKAPLAMADGRVTYGGRPLQTPAGSIDCAAEDGAPVR